MRGPVPSVPCVGFVPLQPPEAVQLVESVELHVRVVASPALTLAGFAATATVGAGAGPAMPSSVVVPPEPLHPTARRLQTKIAMTARTAEVSPSTARFDADRTLKMRRCPATHRVPYVRPTCARTVIPGSGETQGRARKLHAAIPRVHPPAHFLPRPFLTSSSGSADRTSHSGGGIQ